MKLGIIFSGQCNSTFQESGFDTPSTIKCVHSRNILSFKVGKIIAQAKFINVSDCLEQAKKMDLLSVNL